MKAYEWIEQLKIQRQLTSDYQAAKLLDIPTNQISNYKSGRVPTISDEIAVRIAKLLCIKPIAILADQQAERAKTPATMKAWDEIAQRYKYILCQIEWLIYEHPCKPSLTHIRAI